MRRIHGNARNAAFMLGSILSIAALARSAQASTTYGTLNNFDCVNDTGVEAHGFDIELIDLRSTDITYTYDYNHYGVPKITEDLTDPAHPKVLVRYTASRDAAGNWSAFTAIPSGPISPTDGHQFTNPSVNFGGEHFGVGYYGNPTAVKYNWLIDDGSGTLIHGPAVYVSTPTFTYAPPVAVQPAQVQAVIVPPPPPVAPPQQFGQATWVKSIKTTTHNARSMDLRDLVDPDPDDPAAPNWTNGEPDEVEVEWRILQTEFANPDNPKGELAGAPEDLPGGDEVISRRYEFYKYIGPVDAESGEAMGDAVGADGVHGVGSVTYNDSIDPTTGEWVTVTVDLSTVEVVGEFFGAQMSAFDVAPALGLIDHIPDGELNVAYAGRTVVIAAGAPFFATTSGGPLPDGTTLDPFTGVFSGTPTASGAFTFTVDVDDLSGAIVSKAYTVTISGAEVVGSRQITTSAAPAAGGTTEGGGTYADGTPVAVIATHAPGYAFVGWTEAGVPVSASTVYPFTVNADRTLVANFVLTYTVTTSASPSVAGTTSGDGTYLDGDFVVVNATASPGYAFLHWTEGGAIVSTSSVTSFTAGADRSLVANFAVTYTVATSASPSVGGTTAGDGTYLDGDGVVVSASASSGFAFRDWTEVGVLVSSSSTYAFDAIANRNLVANFVATHAVSTSATPSAGGTTSGDGTYREGDDVTVTATAASGYLFVRWTEGSEVVSTASGYTFVLGADRALVAVFVPDIPSLSIASVTATRGGGKIEVTLVIANEGAGAAGSVSIDAKKDATLDGMATKEHPPVVLGDIAAGGTTTTSLTFTGVKAGAQTVRIRLVYSGGVATLTAIVDVP